MITSDLPNLASGILAVLARVLTAATGAIGTLILVLQMVGSVLPALVHLGVDMYTAITGKVAPEWLMTTAKVADFIGALADWTAGFLSGFAFGIGGVANKVIDLLKGFVPSFASSVIGFLGNVGYLMVDHRNEVLQYGTPDEIVTECKSEGLSNC
jgi:hypothetical protein